MKVLFIFFTLFFSANAFSEVCTAHITDYRRIEYFFFTRISYSMEAACSQAMWDCQRILSERQSHGDLYGAFCELKNHDRVPPRTEVRCHTDLVDYYNRIVRTYEGHGRDLNEACMNSDNYCKRDLASTNQYGMRCITRNDNGRWPSPVPPLPPMKTENCRVSRFDPAGMFIESYEAMATGPVNTDVRRQACDVAYGRCMNDLKGRQFCREN